MSSVAVIGMSLAVVLALGIAVAVIVYVGNLARSGRQLTMNLLNGLEDAGKKYAEEIKKAGREMRQDLTKDIEAARHTSRNEEQEKFDAVAEPFEKRMSEWEDKVHHEYGDIEESVAILRREVTAMALNVRALAQDLRKVQKASATQSASTAAETGVPAKVIQSSAA